MPMRLPEAIKLPEIESTRPTLWNKPQPKQLPASFHTES